MSQGGTIQLVTTGNVEPFLTGENPPLSFFRQVIVRTTKFAMESMPIEIDGDANFGRRVSCLIPRKADLLAGLTLEVELPPLPQIEGQPTNYWVNDIGNFLIHDVSIQIGEQEIDKLLNTWLKIWAELTIPASQRDGYNELVGHWDVYPPSPISYDITQPLRLTVELPFWFRRISTALPLVALQAHPVRLIMHLSEFQDCVWNTNYPPAPGVPCPTIPHVSITHFQMYGEYIYLATQERLFFAKQPHEYLITQLQYTPVQTLAAGINKTVVPLNFNNCCREFIWTVQLTRMEAAHEWFNFSNRLTNNGGDPWAEADLMNRAQIQLNGVDRFHPRGARYFRLTQPFDHHTCIPLPPNNIYCYAFDIKPEAEQPSGYLNCSAIPNIVLYITFNPAWLNYERIVMVYTQSYNILRIKNGLGGVMYIN